MEPNPTIQEVSVVYNRPRVDDMVRIGSSQDMVTVMRSVMNENQIDFKEFFWVILLSRSNHVLGVCHLSTGNTSGTTVNIKEIFQLALKTNASAVILCHNHPSGNVKPSDSDVSITKKVATFANLIEVQLLDHVILTSESYYSFSDEGQLPR